MTESWEYDLLDEVTCTDTCEAVIALCELVNKMVRDIQHLELKCISTRYRLSQHMDEEQGELLRMDIQENLGSCFSENPAYTLYKDLIYNGGDPMRLRDYLVKVQKACRGEYPCWH